MMVVLNSVQGWNKGFYSNEKVNELDKLGLYKYKKSKMDIIVEIDKVVKGTYIIVKYGLFLNNIKMKL
jgi:hypothetical protein